MRAALDITGKNKGSVPLYLYFADKGKYALQPQSSYVAVSEKLLADLRATLGSENVVYNQ